MSDLIDRDAAIDTLADMPCKSDEDGYVWIVRSDAWARIDALPSAQPEIIRCKDCEYYELTEWVAHRCNLLGRSVYGNDFCAWAEPYKGDTNGKNT